MDKLALVPDAELPDEQDVSWDGSPEGRPLTSKQQRFVAEYMKDLNGTQAAIRAGYSAHTANEAVPSTEAHARVQSAETLPRWLRGYEAGENFAKVRSWISGRGMLIGTVPGLRRVARDLLTRFASAEERLVIVRPRRADLEQLAEWLAQGRLETVIDSRFPLAQFHDAFRVLESKHARGKIILEVS